MAASIVMPESICEGLEFFEANNRFLMALMEETQEDQYCEEEDRLMSMIQSLEAEISSSSSCSSTPYNYQMYDVEVGQVEDQDCSMSSISWEDIEVVSASSSLLSSSSYSSFDEDMMDAWSLCAARGDDNSGDYNSSEFYYGVLLENYLPQEATDDHVVF